MNKTSKKKNNTPNYTENIPYKYKSSKWKNWLLIIICPVLGTQAHADVLPVY